jgi:hypothetical protein
MTPKDLQRRIKAAVDEVESWDYDRKLMAANAGLLDRRALKKEYSDDGV